MVPLVNEIECHMKTPTFLKLPLRKRRSFLKALGVSPLSALFSGCSETADRLKAEKTSSPPEAQVQALTEIIRYRYGGRFSDQQWLEIKSDIEAILKNGQGLRQIQLRNSDEPDVVFSAARIHFSNG
jgi:hypothetical protein